MSRKLLACMPEIARLTRSGQLQQATGAIQDLLGGNARASATNELPKQSRQASIEGVFRVINEGVKSPQRAANDQTVYPQSRPAAKRKSDDNSGGGRFVAGSFTNPAGMRDYKLYIPSTAQQTMRPLVVMLHGCTQNSDDFAVGTRMNELAEDRQCIVVYPAQAQSANISKCWNWFKQGDQRRGQGEPSIIAGLTRRIIDAYAIDPQRVYIAGLSAGGAMAVVMAKTYPELYAAAGIHSGIPYAAAHDMRSAFAAMRQGKTTQSSARAAQANGSDGLARIVPTIVFHGDQDTTVNARNSEQLIAQMRTAASAGENNDEALRKPRVSVQRGQATNGHAYTHSVYSDAGGKAMAEHWLVHGAGHAWSGGNPEGSYTDPQGPDASRQMLRFFLAHSTPKH